MRYLSIVSVLPIVDGSVIAWTADKNEVELGQGLKKDRNIYEFYFLKQSNLKKYPKLISLKTTLSDEELKQ